MIKLNAHILKQGLVLVLLAAFWRTSFARDEVVDLPREVTISHLGEKGDRMRVFSEPKVSINRKDAVRMVPGHRSGGIDPTPAFEITTTSKNDGGPVLTILRPFGVEPLTRYRLSWDQKVESSRGAPPEFHLECVDINFDKIGEIAVPLKITAQPSGWEQVSVEFTTSPQTRNIRLAFRTPKGGAVHVWLDQVWLEQTSERSSFRPALVTVADGVTPASQAVVFPIPAARRALTLSAEIQWSAWDGRCEVQFEWLDQNASPVGKHTCRIVSMKGVLPQWNGITVDWIGDLHRPTDPISEARTEHLDAAAGTCTATALYTVAVPSGVSAVRIRWVNDTKAGSIVVNQVAVGAEQSVDTKKTRLINPGS